MPIYADTEWCARKAGFIPEFPIIWKKKHGTQKMFGSYPFPPTIIHTPMTERICVWRKSGKYQKKSKEEKELSRIDKQDWADFGVDWWEINAETKSNHPAPFPKELVRRILLLWSFENDVVFDPFIGSGTVAVVAKEMKRQFIGSEYLNEYCEIAKERIDAI